VAFDPLSGNIYIADTGNNRIRAVNTVGTITTIIGTGIAGYTGDNGPAAGATLNKPSAVVEDSTGNLYILDTGNDVVREVNTTGTITTIAGNGTVGYSGDNGPATSATLNTPNGLNIDSSGNLYIADSKNDAIRIVTTAGIITTVTGNGTPGYSGDGGPASSATLNNPQGVTIDSVGNVYISDQNNDRVREVNTPVGSVIFPTTSVNSTSTAVTIPLEVNTPATTITGMTVPVSQGGKQEYTITATGCALNAPLEAGTICDVTATFTPGYPGQRPVPLQVASSGGTFNFGMDGIGTASQLALSPGIITTMPYTAVGSGSFLSGGIAVDSAGNIFAAVADEGLITVSLVEFAAGTGAETAVPTGAYYTNLTFELAVDSAENLYLSDFFFSCILKVVPGSAGPIVVAGVDCENGDPGFSGDNGLATNAQLNSPYGLAVDIAGNLYIADSGNNRIRKVAAGTGTITTVAGSGTYGYSGDGGPATSAGLDEPRAVAVDAAGNLYIADTADYRVRKVAAGTGIITTVAGSGTYGYSGDGGPATSAQLVPEDIKIDSAGNLYIADDQLVIRMVNTAGIISTVAGNGTSGATGDGGPATAAELQAEGLAIDSAGNLYISAITGVRTVNVSASALNFASAVIGSTTTQTAAVTNIGNAPLTFTAPASGQNPSISAGFSLDSSSTCPQLSAGSQPATLPSGTSCSLVVDFVPTTANILSGTASIADNGLNASQVQTVQLNAGAGETSATTTTVNVTTPIYGQTQISATVLATSGTLAPVGSVVFTVDGAVQPAVTVNSSGVAALPVAVSNALVVGSHTIAAVYTSSSLGFTNSNATRIFSVSQAPPTITVEPSTTSLSVTPGSSVTDTITITPMNGYSGTLQFSCTGLPQNATCSFQPSTVTLSGTSGPQTTVITIQTAGSTAGLVPGSPSIPGNNPLLPATAFWIPGLLTMGLAGTRRRLSARFYHPVILLALFAGISILAGCGGGSSPAQSTTPTAPTTPSAPVTPAGTSSVKIMAANSGTTVQSFTLTLTVQ
jgi:trimeric autotransporter adhesin